MTMTTSRTKRPAFPFSAVVGQETAKLALLLNAVSPTVGGVLILGEKGNAKSTAVRALAHMLPPVPVVPDCPLSCDPEHPFTFCPQCRGTRWTGEYAYRKAPFVEMPLGASEDRLLGHMDIEAAMARGERYFEPGLLARAHRGILYVDEINLLPDHLIDILLDAAASGWNQVERDGFSVTHPARFILVGTMNPEEGELRPQLLDRFGLSVEVSTPQDVASRTEIMKRRMAYEAAPALFAEQWELEEQAEQEHLAQARSAFADTELPDKRLEQVARLCLQAKTEGMRADLIICETAKAIAAYRGHPEVTAADVNEAAPLALYHRSQEPWQPEPDDDPDGGGSGQDSERAAQREGDEAGEAGRSGAQDPDGGGSGQDTGPQGRDGPESPEPAPAESPSGTGGGSPAGSGASSPSSGTADAGPGLPPSSQRPYAANSARLDDGNRPDHPRSGQDAGTPLGPLPDQLLPADSLFRLDPALLRRTNGLQPNRVPVRINRGSPRSRGSKGRVQHHQAGSHVRSRPLIQAPSTARFGPDTRIDWGKTVISAGIRQRLRRNRPDAVLEPSPAFAIHREDIQEKVFQLKPRQLNLFLLDASGSMASYQRMKETKAAVLSLMERSYQQRESFALVCFRHNRAELNLAPTRSIQQARRVLAELPSGGGTPLALGLKKSGELLSQWLNKEPGLQPNLYLLTDGKMKTSAPSAGADSYEAALLHAQKLAKEGYPTTVIDTETGRIRLGLARKLAQALHAKRYCTLQELRLSST